MKLIVGLGNPGRAYARTRHNVGFSVIDALAKRHRVRVSRRMCGALVGLTTIRGEEVALAKPQTFMNLSGGAVALLGRRLNAPPDNIVVIYDDAALPPGRIRIRPRGSSGGHKGMKSIIESLRTQDFPRLRIGIGSMRGDAVNYVLSKFSRAELALVKPSIQSAADAVDVMVSDGIEAAMNRYNRSEDNG